jgi:hypothetical protein
MGEGNISNKHLADVQLQSLDILLFDAMVAQKFSSKYDVVRFRVRNWLVGCLRIKYEKP